MRSVFALILTVAVGHVAVAQEVLWPGFRGGPAAGVVQGTTHPLTWRLVGGDREGNRQNVAWIADVPGLAWSSPVVVDDTVYVTTAVTPDQPAPRRFGGGGGAGSVRPTKPAEFRVIAYSLGDGGERWSTTVARLTPDQPTHPANSFATESPTTDGRFVFVHFGHAGVLAALTLDGDVVWRRELGTYRFSSDFGTGSSIAYHDGVVVVHSDNNESAFIAGFDAETGDELWRTPRDRGSAWASPLVVPGASGAQVIVPGRGHVTSYEPKSGEQIWKATGIRGGFSASPSVGDGHVYVGNSSRSGTGPLLALRLDARGEYVVDPADDRVRWLAASQGFEHTSAVVVGNTIYAARDAFFAAHDIRTGERLYRVRLPDGGIVVASAWAVGDTVFVLNESGQTYAIAAGGEFRLLATNMIDGDLFSATPSVARGTLLIRGGDKLYAIREDD
ncbi:MAG: PQQ-binding-like beta-propeller repeat protein [Planctomycetota bacterium]